MTEHLGDRISPLIDHQLDPGARDRALAHLAGCGDCQREVAALRQVKARLVALGDPALPENVADRLLRIGAGMAGTAHPEPEHRRSPPGSGGVAAGAGVRPAGAVPPAHAASAAAGRVTSAGGPSSSPARRPDVIGHGRRAAQPTDRVASRGGTRRRALESPGGTGRGARAAPRRGAPRRPGARPGRTGDRPRRPPSPPLRPVQGRSSMRRTLLGSAALLMLAVTGAAVADGRSSARPGGPIAVPTVSSVVAPGSSTGSSLRLIPMFAPMKVSLHR
ncbi:anti-sigma factor family protein [Frankia gtarii]|uniref:anti-sigma factor family protein n=1 Tax=Frankia gtarii TaxID=2950102 RepID=UPI0021C22FDD|nr:zf-HC2 domain-containing protein [Frankia gtarii]